MLAKHGEMLDQNVRRPLLGNTFFPNHKLFPDARGYDIGEGAGKQKVSHKSNDALGGIMQSERRRNRKLIDRLKNENQNCILKLTY